MNSQWISISVLSAALLFGFNLVHAADGELDAGFAAGGKLELALDFAAPNDDLSRHVVVDSDRSYIIGGTSTNLGFAPVIVRLKHNGDLDPSYGQAGLNVVNSLYGIYDTYTFRTAALQSDGKLVAAGEADVGANTDMLACRFHTNGTLDATFGNEQGCTRIKFDLIANGFDQANAILIKPNGRVLLAGYSRAANNVQRMAVAQLNTLGLPDESFGGGGRVDLGFPLWTHAWANALLLDRQGRILVGGTIQENVQYPCDADFAVMRLEPSGSLDMSYGNAGRTRIGFDIGPTLDNCTYWHDQLAGMSLASNGSLFVGGSAQFSWGSLDSKMAVAKLDMNGTPDPSFGTGGKLSHFVCDVCLYSYAYSFMRRPDGKMLFAGSTYPATNNSQTFVIRLAANGMPEITKYVGFDSPSDENDNAGDHAFSLALQSGRPLVVGVTDLGADYEDHNMTAVRLDDDYIFFNDLE